MAKKLSKKQRQLQKQKQQNKLIRAGYSAKEVEHISNADLQKLATSNIPHSKVKDVESGLKLIDKRERDRQRAKERRQTLQNQRMEKLEHLERIIGADPLSFEKQPTARFLDGLSLDDLRKGKYKRSDFKEYIPQETIKPIDRFDFDKVYKIPDGKKLHFAFRSLNGEKDIGEELKGFEKYSNEELLSFLQTIKSMPQTRSSNIKGSKGRNKGSSGQAGEGVIRLNSQAGLTEVYNHERNADRRANTYSKLLSKTAQKRGVRYQHSSIDYHWQNIRQADQNGKPKAYTEITPRKLLIIGNAIMWNITESDRAGFYNEFYSICCEIVPAMKQILP